MCCYLPVEAAFVDVRCFIHTLPSRISGLYISMTSQIVPWHVARLAESFHQVCRSSLLLEDG
jgi:hypothetical protein